MNRTHSFWVVAVVLLSACASTPAGPYVEVGIRNYSQVTPNLSRGGQPTPRGIEELANLGVVTIVNLRPVGHRKLVGEQHASMPLSNWFAPSEEQVTRILDIINDPSRQPVFVHCQRGADRTGTIVAIYRIMHDCWTDEEALREARKHGMGWWQVHMRRFVRRWYQAKRPERCTAG